jgi:type IX secretion system PorP/SprF family membrane protein
MKNKILYLPIIILIFNSQNLRGQSDVKLSNFFLTPMAYNPAYAGGYEGFSLTSLYSSQWVGFDGAPKTIIVNGHGTLKNPNIGFGVEIVHDEIGATSDTKLLGNYAYQVQLNRSWRLALGIKAGVSRFNIDYSKLRILNPEELNDFDGGIMNTNAEIGAGLYLHNENFYLGISVPNYLTIATIDIYNTTLGRRSPNFYMSTGYKFNLQNDLFFQPSALVRVVNGAPVNSLLAGTINWQEKIYGSVNIDFKSTLGFFAGFRFKENYLLGYSYDSSITNFSNANTGIHSVFINFRLADFGRRERFGCNPFF